MNPQQAFFVRLTALAGMCQFTLTPEVLALYDRNLSALGYDRVVAALDEVITRRRSRDSFPSIRDIREIIQPDADPESEALEAVGRIVHAISRVGPYRTKEAREYIGELGWAVVQRDGGWEQVCNVLTDENIGTMKAQWRQMAMAQYKRAKAGLSAAPSLPDPTTPGSAKLLSMANLLPEMPK